jgi:parallel beta-helix repeat protein
MRLDAESVVRRNTVSGNPEAGMILEGNGNEVSRNRVVENGDAVVVAGDANRVTRNEVVDVLGFPDEPGSGFGILVDGGSDNLLQGNDIRDVAAIGIRLTAFDPDATGFAQGNVVRDNRVERTGLDGILVDATATSSLLKLNPRQRRRRRRHRRRKPHDYADAEHREPQW